MTGPTAASAVPVGRARTLAQVYQHFGEVDAAETSPLYERVAVALSESEEAHASQLGSEAADWGNEFTLLVCPPRTRARSHPGLGD